MLVHLEKLDKPLNFSFAENAVTTRNMFCEYPKDAFHLLMKSQCPASSPSCVVDVPFDILRNQRYRCTTGE